MKSLSAKQVFAAGFELQTPFSLELTAEESVIVENTLRILPGKRMVAKGLQNGSVILLKLFRHRRNLKQESDGYKRFKKAGIRTPQQLRTGQAGNGGYSIYEYLPQAEALDTYWQKALPEEKNRLFHELLQMLQQMYQASVYQTDLHMGNFVISGGMLYALDPASCMDITPRILPAANLALLLAQCFPLDWPEVSRAIIGYFPSVDAHLLEKKAKIHWRQRSKDYLRKIFRDCSEVANLSDARRHILCHRASYDEALKQILNNPESALAGGKLIKDSRSTTVVKIDICDKSYVIKRYQNADRITAMRRRFGRSRAGNNWYFSHLLLMLGIKTPQPIALIEASKGVFDFRSYYISEFVEGDNAYNVFTKISPTQKQLKGIRDTFNLWRWAGIEHRDCKSTNWIVHDEEIMIVDLDAMRETARPGTGDQERFLRDWADHPELQRLFIAQLHKGNAGI